MKSKGRVVIQNTGGRMVSDNSLGCVFDGNGEVKCQHNMDTVGEPNGVLCI